jgi:NAD(P)-dependent dehydrogenase (short-subunit alcohol dehydrogenase family)
MSAMQIEKLFSVAGLNVAITGGASGIGFGYAQAMARNGAHVNLIDVNQAGLDSAVAQLRTEGGDAHGERADVTKEDELRRALEAATARHRRLDVMFANAGISGGPGFLKTDGTRNPESSFENLSPELWNKVLGINLSSIFRTIQLVTPQMKKQGGGRIIVTSSISATKVETHVSSIYVASKAALTQLVRQAALELARYNIRVNAIAPGPVITNIAGGRLKDPVARAPFEQANPMHRIATPEDLHGAALYLASNASNYVTGIQILVDGGGSMGVAD